MMDPADHERWLTAKKAMTAGLPVYVTVTQDGASQKTVREFLAALVELYGAVSSQSDVHLVIYWTDKEECQSRF